jgi:hypothetical protein
VRSYKAVVSQQLKHSVSGIAIAIYILKHCHFYHNIIYLSNHFRSQSKSKHSEQDKQALSNNELRQDKFEGTVIIYLTKVQTLLLKTKSDF